MLVVRTAAWLLIAASATGCSCAEAHERSEPDGAVRDDAAPRAPGHDAGAAHDAFVARPSDGGLDAHDAARASDDAALTPDAPTPTDAPTRPDAPSTPDAWTMGADAGCGPRVRTGSAVVTSRIDTSRAGAQPTDTLSLPFCRRWTADVFGPVSAIVAADGRVFATVASTTKLSSSHPSLVALDAETGALLWGPMPLRSGYWASEAGLGYDAGRVFATVEHTVHAFDAASGSELWQTEPSAMDYISAPVARDGRVFVGGGAAGPGVTTEYEIPYALDAASGRILWTRTFTGTTDLGIAPAVTDSAVYVYGDCAEIFRLDPATGATVWHHPASCDAYAWQAVVVRGDAVYALTGLDGAPSTSLILDAADGSVRGDFDAIVDPVFDDTSGYYVRYDALARAASLVAIPLGASAPAWSFVGAPGSYVGAPPLLVGASVLVAIRTTTDATLYALSTADGSILRSLHFDGIERFGAFTEADGLLFVSTANALSAY